VKYIVHKNEKSNRTVRKESLVSSFSFEALKLGGKQAF